MPITTITTGVLVELSRLGYATSTLKCRKRALSAIAKWFAKEAGGVFTEADMARYSALLESQLSARLLSKQWYNIKTRCLEHMRLYAAGESVCCGYAKCGHREFEPSAAAIKLIDDILVGKPDLSERFKYKLHGVLRKFMCYVEGMPLPIESISRSVMIDYIRHCSGVSRGQMQYIARGLTELAKYLVINGRMERTPDFKFIIPSMRVRKIIPAFTVPEVAAILSSIDQSTALGKRNYAMILLAVSTGLRAGDIIRLKLRDINWESGEISIVQSKTQGVLIVPVSGQMRNVLSDYILSARPQSDSITVFLRSRAPFSALSAPPTNMFVRCAEKAGVENKTGRAFHSLRRSFGTWLAKERVPITTISQLLGHADMDSSKPYLSFDDIQLSECAMGFSDIPLTRRIFDDVHRTT